MGLFFQKDFQLKLTPELFGKLMVLAWAEEHGRSTMPTSQELTEILLEESGSLPEEVKGVMHQDPRRIGVSIYEMTDYIASAQAAGLISRDNPSYLVGTVRVGAWTAHLMLEDYEKKLPNVVSWLRQQIKKSSAKHIA